MDLSIIIVNYNVKEFLQNLLDSIKKATTNITSEVIIVDNASDDGSIEFLRENYPWVILIENENNLGFSKANNLGLKIAKGRYLLLLNPDTLVQEDTFDTMIKFMEENPEAGMSGCKMIGPDGNLQLACRRSFPGPWVSFCKVTGLGSIFPNSKLFAQYNLTYLDENQTYEVDAISGAFMLVSREMYETMGGLDEQFFMYGEDLDWCYRVQLAGKKVYYVHTTQIIHYKGESTKRSNMNETKVFYDAMHLFVRKHLASSFFIEFFLRLGITLRETIAYLAKNKLIVLSVILDFVFLNIAIYSSEHIYTKFSKWRGFPDYATLVVYTFPAIVHILASFITGSYKRERLSVLKNLNALLLGFLTITTITFFLKDYAFSRMMVVISYSAAFMLLGLWRFLAKVVFKVGSTMSSLSKSKVAVIGTGSSSTAVAKRLLDSDAPGSTLVGLIGLTRREIGEVVEGVKVVGAVDNLANVIRDKGVTEVIFPPEQLSYQQMMMIVSACQKENVEFQIAAKNLEFLVGKSQVKLLSDLPVIEFNYNISKGSNKALKRVFDFVLAVVIFIVCFPILFVTGKIFSKNKSRFTKMLLSAGKVIKGEMSLVGPENPAEYKNLYLGKRGVTGIWFTDLGDEHNREKLDIFYAKNQNIWLDIEILGKTFNKLMMKRN